jgi:hypothetical protein
LKELSEFAPALKTALTRRISSLSFNQQYYAQNLARIGLGINQKYAAIELSYNKHSLGTSISRGVFASATWGRPALAESAPHPQPLSHEWRGENL